MKIQTLLIALLSILHLQVAAQQESAAGELLEKLAENNRAYQSIRADFTFHYQSLQSDARNAWKGTITMKGKKYRLELRNSTVYYNGKTLWNYLHEAGEVNISEPVEQEGGDILNHPHQIFDIHQMDLKNQYLGKEKKDGHELYAIDLFPNDLDQEYSRIRLYLEQSPVQIHSTRIFAKDGSRYTIEINNLTTDQPVADSTFVFNKKAHPDVEVIDMRF
ncbi:MAG: outer membrane lipoprotein carrier protein LolA [Bacteroidales bacterium]|nr:outer membrane lipoprotein carrier protein LolA [Bacteroidales bacterium]